MKKILLASSALAAMTAAAYADGHEGGITTTGDARMGLIYDEANDENEFGFNSRIRIKFAASGTTDGGLTFGGEVRADNSSDGAAGEAGSVFISGEFGKLSMGDVDGAARAAVGHVDGVGYVNQDDTNESTYLQNAGDDPSALYEYSINDFGIKASVEDPGAAGEAGFAVGFTYAVSDFTFGLGYEDTRDDASHIILGVSATLADVTLKAIYGTADLGDEDEDQFAVSASYDLNGVGLTAFYTDDSDLPDGLEAIGVGASYDLGGGAAVKTGVVSIDGGDGGDDRILADLGLTFDF